MQLICWFKDGKPNKFQKRYFKMDKNITLEYYSQKAEEFTNDTQGIIFTELQDKFLEYLKANAKILDLGCGSGRDSKYFIDKGYSVVALDGCKELCEIATKNIGQNVIHSTFEDFETEEKFDGIWACASLLHLQIEKLPSIIEKYANKLNQNGCFYLSFKYGDFSGMKNGRYFTYLTEEAFKQVIANIESLKIISLSITGDVRKGRETEKWLNIFLMKQHKARY